MIDTGSQPNLVDFQLLSFFVYLQYAVCSRINIGTTCRSSGHELSPTGSLEIIPGLDPTGRLSISLDADNCLIDVSHGHVDTVGVRSSTLDTRRSRHPYDEAKSFVCLPQVQLCKMNDEI